MTVDVMQYAELFQAEAGEYMQILNKCLLQLEKDPKDRDELHEAFRAVHSLKGMAGTMGYQHVTDIAHGLESFMEDFKAGDFEPSPEILDLLFEAVDHLQSSLDHPEESREQDRNHWEALLERMKKTCDEDEGDTGEEIEDVDRLGESGDEDLALGEMDREILRQALDRGACPCLVKVVLRQDVMMKAVRVYMIFKALENFGEIVASFPTQQDLEEEKFDQLFQVMVICENSAYPDIEGKVMQITDVEAVEAAPWGRQEQVEAEPLDPVEPDDPVPSDKESVAEIDFSLADKVLEEQEEGVSEISPVPVTAPVDSNQATRAVDKVVRVETQKLDDLVNLVGEMVVARTRISEIGRGFSEELDSTIDQLKRSITNLHETAMELRMVPIKQVFERFPRMVRDLCREKGKKIELYISGEETELDRTIINRLSDPLVHLLRNAFDHGIESPEERLQKGKPVEGSIYLKACHEGNQVVITVEDDGAGIDPEKIGNKALEKGIITRTEMAQLSKDDMINLIFLNGFSTSAAVTDVSGRGVGMDAVRTSIEALHGNVEVSSEIGVRTSFVLRLPLTLAIIKTLLVRSANQLYAVPVEVIRENVFLHKEDIKSIRGNPVVNLRGEVIPLYSLSGLLGFDLDRLAEGDCSVVIVEAANQKAGFIVEELVGQQEIMIKSLGGILKGLKGVAGAAVLGDGSVTLIVDVAGLISEGRDYIE